MKNYLILLLLAAAMLFSSCKKTPAPQPLAPVPDERQMNWHRMEFYAFVHFNMNTFTGMEWGTGGEDPALFNPTALDCRQWAKVCSDAGMKGIIITAKHHDGFCLWPSAYTEHSVKNSPWKEGKGDVVRELSEACSEYGLKFGVYLSPWDRNHSEYGRPEYIPYFRNQLRELLTSYGEVFEVWFDGANGGTGWYGGANENRVIDAKTYYEWPATYDIVRELQPGAVIFSDASDIRWVGNEEGWASSYQLEHHQQECLSGIGHAKPGDSPLGRRRGTDWVPAEVDVSIRPGWYYHRSEDHKVKSLSELLNIYYESVGRNASLLLNLPVDDRGLVHEKDVEALMKLAEALKADFAVDLAAGRKVMASNVRGNARKFRASNVNDGNPQTYWATDDSVMQASLMLDFGKDLSFNRFMVQEFIPLGQRVKRFTVEALVDGTWQMIAEETTIGYKRILRIPETTARQVRFSVTDSRACPLISNLQLFLAPKVMEIPVISRDQEPFVTISAADPGTDIHFTTDGSELSASSARYDSPFVFNTKGEVGSF